MKLYHLALVLRVLYRLRTLSEQAPFDAASFAFVFPLLGRILHEGGIDVPDEEERLEQVTLVLDILKFHCSECMASTLFSMSLTNLSCSLKSQISA